MEVHGAVHNCYSSQRIMQPNIGDIEIKVPKIRELQRKQNTL